MTKKKKVPLFLLIAVAGIALAATTHDYFLLPENFFIHKGDKLNLHLLAGDLFVKQAEVSYQAKKTATFMLYQGSKKIDLTKMAKDSAAPLISYDMVSSGQMLIEMNTGVDHNTATRDNYADFLTQLGYDKLGEQVKNGNQFRVKEKFTRYMKTLFSVDNHDGSAYSKVLKEDFELILEDDPYRKKYGEDMTVQLKFKDKPAGNATISLYIKSIGGNVYTQSLTTDKHGEATFTMSREGIYMLRSVRCEATKDSDADYESWWASYTFPFSSSDEVPNTYKEFGFGNIH
jgi:uncharacterized GH25 family protein